MIDELKAAIELLLKDVQSEALLRRILMILNRARNK